MCNGNLVRISIAKHKIELLPNSNPVHSELCLAGPTVREFQRLEIEKRLSQNVIEPAQTLFAAQIVLAPKKDGSLHFSVGYSKRNNLSRWNLYFIPRINEGIDCLGEATVLSTIDANSGYWIVEIEDRDGDETTFTSHHGLFQPVRMPIDFKNAPEAFQTTMGTILTKVEWQYVSAFLYENAVFATTSKKHVDQAKQVLTLLKRAGVTLNLKK